MVAFWFVALFTGVERAEIGVGAFLGFVLSRSRFILRCSRSLLLTFQNSCGKASWCRSLLPGSRSLWPGSGSLFTCVSQVSFSFAL
jgi:hypothetical protein